MQELERLYQPIVKDRLSARVADRIQDFILTGELQPGDRLPSERELVERLGVSRIVIREAMKVLEERGLVEVRSGSGTFIAQIRPESISESIGLLLQQQEAPFEYLHEIRRILETEMTALAAERGTPADLESMAQAIEDMRQAVASIEARQDALEEFVQADLDFHNALARAAQNPLFIILIHSLSDLLLEFRRAASSVPGAPRNALQFHERIYELVCARRTAEARNEMMRHLLQAAEYSKAYEASRSISHRDVR
jgi:GntR family transcriptional repressor for pyruvate dehydrogenase complex